MTTAGSEQFSIHNVANNSGAGCANTATQNNAASSPSQGTYAAAAILTGLGGSVRWRPRRKA
jgi:MYXO-CTERM domain-containing protein